jgi:tetratricopeptide (TPR) repeat protein
LAAAAALLAVAIAPADAQPTRRPPRPDTPYLTVQVFRSADKIAGPAASDALREELIRTYPGPVLWVIEKERLIELLEQSGYPSNEQLARSDENALAKFQRADEYIRGAVTQEADGQWRVDAQLVLTRDLTLVQPLEPARGNRPDRAARAVIRSLNAARDQLPFEKRCVDHARNQRYAQALAEAEKAIAQNPQATLVRYCKMNVLVAQNAANADKIKVAEEILAIDPNSRGALAIAADAYKADGQVDKSNEYLVRLLAAEPNNASLAQRVVDALAASRQYDMARRVVDQAVADNPGDLGLMRLRFLILAASGDYKPAIAAGEELVQLDTAAGDVGFWTRLTALYLADSNATGAVGAAQRGTTKFPQEASLWQLQAQALRTSGDVPGSVNAAKKALEINPFQPNGWLQVAQAYIGLQQPDSALAALQQATVAGDGADPIATLISSIGNSLRVRGDQAKDMVLLRQASVLMLRADSVAQLADEVGPPDARRPRAVAPAETKARVKFLVGITAVQLGQVLATNAGQQRSCELAREADQAFVNAMIALPQGASFNQQAAVTLLQSIPELQKYVTDISAQLCKP